MNTDEVITEDLLIENPRFPPRLKRQKAFRNLHDYNLEYNYTLNYSLEFNQGLDTNEILELNFNDNLYRSSPSTNNDIIDERNEDKINNENDNNNSNDNN